MVQPEGRIPYDFLIMDFRVDGRILLFNVLSVGYNSSIIKFFEVQI